MKTRVQGGEPGMASSSGWEKLIIQGLASSSKIGYPKGEPQFLKRNNKELFSGNDQAQEKGPMLRNSPGDDGAGMKSNF